MGARRDGLIRRTSLTLGLITSAAAIVGGIALIVGLLANQFVGVYLAIATGAAGSLLGCLDLAVFRRSRSASGWDIFGLVTSILLLLLSACFLFIIYNFRP